MRTYHRLTDSFIIFIVLMLLLFFLFSIQTNNSWAVKGSNNGSVPVVYAQEMDKTENYSSDVEESEEQAPLRPNHPPIDEIPPMPMPDPSIQEDMPAKEGQGAGILHDATTDETSILWINNPSEATTELTKGGGYKGSDGGQNGSERLEATFNDMYQINNTGNFPWRMNTKLVMRFEDNSENDRWYVCSGSMRDAETVLTAGHCVYSQDYGWAEEIWVYPGWDGNGWELPPDNTVENYGWGHGTNFGSWTWWTEDGNWDGDVGLVGITRAVGMLTGWFGWYYGGSCSWHTSMTYHNVSYPAENCPLSGLHNGRDMYYWYGTFDACPNNQLQLNTSGGNCFDTVWGGMSGSGAYFIEDDSRYVHAVCSTSNRNDRGYYCRQWENWVEWTNTTFVPQVRGYSFDLQALNVNAGPAVIPAGHKTDLLNHLATNPTNADPGNTQYKFIIYLSTNDNISTYDTPLSTQYYTYDFGVMSSVRVNMAQVTIPISTPPGDYWLGLVYDSSTDVNSANNDTDGWDAVPIHISPASLPFLPLILMENDS